MIHTTVAYLDAATMSMVFAGIAAAAVTIGTVVAVWFRRVKKKVNDKLGIDENQKKDVEEDVTGNFGN